jgi:hypothetical protein
MRFDARRHARSIRRICVVALAVAVAACSPLPRHTDGRESGRIEIVPIKTYQAIQSKFMLWAVGVGGVPASNAVDCYRIVYPSTDENCA